MGKNRDVSESRNATVPLVRQLWLSKKSARKIALQLIPTETTKACDFRAPKMGIFPLTQQGHYATGQGNVSVLSDSGGRSYSQSKPER